MRTSSTPSTLRPHPPLPYPYILPGTDTRLEMQTGGDYKILTVPITDITACFDDAVEFYRAWIRLHGDGPLSQRGFDEFIEGGLNLHMTYHDLTGSQAILVLQAIPELMSHYGSFA